MAELSYTRILRLSVPLSCILDADKTQKVSLLDVGIHCYRGQWESASETGIPQKWKVLFVQVIVLNIPAYLITNLRNSKLPAQFQIFLNISSFLHI